MTIRIAPAIAVLAFALTQPLAADENKIKAEIVEESDGTRTLIHEAVIDAPLAVVWATLSTAEGWKRWGPKFAEFDFRTGGSIETGYQDNAKPGDPQNIRHRILAIVPERLLALRVEQVPEGGPVDAAVLEKAWGVYELSAVDEQRTRLRISGHGYGADPASVRMLEFFKTGNVYSIELLRRNLAASSEGAMAE